MYVWVCVCVSEWVCLYECTCYSVAECRGTWVGGEDREVPPGLLGSEERNRDEESWWEGRQGNQSSGLPRGWEMVTRCPRLRSKLRELTLGQTQKEQTWVSAGLEGVFVIVPSDLGSKKTRTQLAIKELDLWAWGLSACLTSQSLE